MQALLRITAMVIELTIENMQYGGVVHYDDMAYLPFL